jgi:NIMA (never in mitosis gene a)-related kinase
MEYCEGGDLKDKIDEHFYANKHFSKKEILDYFIQLCEGLLYLHSKKIIHRDIKSQNIFLKDNGKIRIGDFGLAKKIKNRNTIMTKVGTDSYMAPEVIQGETYGKAADVWGIGCIIYELCTLNFMWLCDKPLGISSLTRMEFVDGLIEDINKEYNFFKPLLRSIFVSGNLRLI